MSPRYSVTFSPRIFSPCLQVRFSFLGADCCGTVDMRTWPAERIPVLTPEKYAITSQMRSLTKKTTAVIRKIRVRARAAQNTILNILICADHPS